MSQTATDWQGFTISFAGAVFGPRHREGGYRLVKIELGASPRMLHLHRLDSAFISKPRLAR